MKTFEDNSDLSEIVNRINELLKPLLIKAEQQRSNGYVNDRMEKPFDKENEDSSCSE